MASNVHLPATTTVNPDTQITVKVTIDGNNRKFKLPLKELTAALFEEKLRTLLQVPQGSNLVLERYSDSVGAHVPLKASNSSAYKQLYRAAKAKLRLRIRASIESSSKTIEPSNIGIAVSAPPQPSPVPASLLDMAPNHAELAYLTQRPAMASATTLIGSDQSPSPLASSVETPASPASNKMPEPTPKCQMLRGFPPCELDLPLREVSVPPPPPPPPVILWRVYCNSCEATMDNVHFHCSICEAGDYDLCEKCVSSGVTCPGENHWLIKRFTVNGKMINSTTERIAPKARATSSNETTLPSQAYEAPVPGSLKTGLRAKTSPVLTRTCNSCVAVVPQSLMVNCVDCDDYDICIPCHLGRQHGHHPGHTFVPIDKIDDENGDIMNLCAPGRNFSHAAICDGCSVSIRGVRYKCLTCPDWDYCNKCHLKASQSHPGHRFAPLYDSIGFTCQSLSHHWGIFCDGPLCKGKTRQSYIKGTRYKCAVCHDTDFCANCEAHPMNTHNHTHPLIKFRNQVTNVSVTTIEENVDGKPLTHGDKHSVPVIPPPPYPHLCNTEYGSWKGSPCLPTFPRVVNNERNAATTASVTRANEDCVGGEEREGIPAVRTVSATAPLNELSNELNARFVRDRIADGSALPPSTTFMQSWTLENPGPHPWPVGCTVHSVGGDNMLNLDRSLPTSVNDLNLAQVSNATNRVIEVGQEATFVVVMRTSAREGRYISYWRLKSPDGTPFGNKLWCDIEVKKGPLPIPRPTPPWIVRPANNAVRHQNSSALADYQMQLMLLEQQNKKRLMMARSEQADSGTKPPNCGPVSTPASILAKCQTETQAQTQDSQSQSGETSGSSASSTMVFPKLEKESPASSTHLTPVTAVTEESSAAVNEKATPDEIPASITSPPAPVRLARQEPDFEDDESLDLEESEDEEDDGFLTDEEYDILDASDDEIVSAIRH